MRAEGHFWCHFCAHCWQRRSWWGLLAPDAFWRLMACILCTHTSLVANTDPRSALIKRFVGQSARAPFIFSPSLFPGSICWFQAPRTMRCLHPPCRIMRCSIPPPHIKVERWLESFPDNRWCFRGPALGGDPGAEQRALEEKGLDLHKGAVTPSHGLNSNQPHRNLASLHRGSVEQVAKHGQAVPELYLAPSDGHMHV